MTIDLYEDNESMMAKLQGGGTSLYDIVVPGQYLIPVMAKLGLLAQLRHENIPNLTNLDAKFVNPVYDPGNKYTAAYQWGTVGIYLRKQPGKAVDETWGLIFDKAKQYGSFLLMDSLREMLGRCAEVQGARASTSTSLDELRAQSAALLAKPSSGHRASRAAWAARTRCSPRRSTPRWSTTAMPCAA